MNSAVITLPGVEVFVLAATRSNYSDTCRRNCFTVEYPAITLHTFQIEHAEDGTAVLTAGTAGPTSPTGSGSRARRSTRPGSNVQFSSEPLQPQVQQNVVAGLAALPHAVTLLCYVDGRPAGLSQVLRGFSTFSCRKLLNIHDITVLAEFRGLGLSQHLLREIEVVARERGVAN